MLPVPVPVELWRVVALILGALVFFNGATLGRSALVHYSIGSLLAVTVAFTFILRRPKSAGMPVLGGVFGLVFASRSQDTLAHVGKYAVVLVLAVAVLGGAALVYVYNPKSNPRICNVIQWSVQGLGLVLVALAPSDVALLRSNLVLVPVLVLAQLLWPWWGACCRCHGCKRGLRGAPLGRPRVTRTGRRWVLPCVFSRCFVF